ncbi:MAG: ABC transporter substrate-binding protein [Acidobacteriota bacterium]
MSGSRGGWYRVRWLGALWALAAVGCGGDETSLPPEESVTVPADGEVVVYVEAPRRVAGPVLALFTQETGVAVRAEYLEVLQDAFLPQLWAEARAGRVDVVWAVSPLTAEDLAREGLARPFRPIGARPVPIQYRDPEFRWVGFAANPRVFIYNYFELDEEEAPRSIEQIALPRFASTGAVPRIVSGAPAFHAAALFSLWGEQRARAFFDEMRAAGVRIVEDDTAVRRSVGSGEARWGLLGLDEAICAKRMAEPVHIVYPDLMRRVGAVVVPHVAVLVENAPNPPQAKGLVAYLFGYSAAWQVGEIDCALITLLPGIKKPDWVPALSQLNVTQLDNRAVYEAYRAHADYFGSWTRDLVTAAGPAPDP